MWKKAHFETPWHLKNIKIKQGVSEGQREGERENVKAAADILTFFNDSHQLSSVQWTCKQSTTNFTFKLLPQLHSGICRSSPSIDGSNKLTCAYFPPQPCSCTSSPLLCLHLTDDRLLQPSNRWPTRSRIRKTEMEG